MSLASLPARFRPLGLLGEGGSGRVYRVHDAIRSRNLALKLVSGDEAMFLRREFDALRQIRHENLIQVFEWGGLPSGECYYTMELIEGENWGDRSGLPQDADAVRSVLTGVLRGLAHLHSHGEIHGDLKPSNVLLGLGGIVKLTDVGMGGGDGRAERASGTPGYAAPEAWEGARADIRSDLYSVGVMGYEALTGVHPFRGRTIREVVAGQLEGWVPSPGVHGVRAPADLEQAVMRALERDRGLRQGSADEFMEGIGVEDRVGQITGGRFVGRRAELESILEILFGDRPGSPSLLTLVGPALVGKGALLEEAAHRVVERGGTFVSFGGVDAPVGVGVPTADPDIIEGGSSPQDGHSISADAEHLLGLGRTTPALVRVSGRMHGPSTGSSYARDLARYVWARSIETGRPARVLFGESEAENRQTSEEFERIIEVRPLTCDEAAEFLSGRVGETKLEAEFIATLHHLTGGSPGALEALIPALVERGILERRRGSWIYRESEQLRSIDVALLPNPWSRGWDRLSEDGVRTLQALALAPRSLMEPQVKALTGNAGRPDLLAALAASGWAVRIGASWSVASEGIRQVIRSRSDKAALRGAALAIIRLPGAVGPEESADLMLEYDQSLEALEMGLKAAVAARSRGDHSLEVARLRRCLGIAEALEPSRAQSTAVELGEALHRVGADAEARELLLRDVPWPGKMVARDSARREQILGAVELSLGHLEDARRSYERGISSARAIGDLVLEARCVAGLAEAGWQHGAESHRTAAIGIIETFIREHGQSSEISEELGALTYQLGSALVRAGEHKRAAGILSRGLESGAPDYWRMRMANALAAANYYVGLFGEALGNLEMAWSTAERIAADSFKARILANRAGLYYGLGRPGDAVDQHKLAVLWARRTGSTFDYLSGCAGASINLTLLARYEEAITYATEVRSAGKRLGDLDEIGKGFELDALARYYLGDYTSAEALVGEGLRAIAGAGYVSVRPRLEWLLGRVAEAGSRTAEALDALRRAETELKRTQDWEDLPGVQIEFHRIQARAESPREHLMAIHDLVVKSGAEAPLLVLLNGALAIGEILVERDIDHGQWMEFLSQALARAEGGEIREFAWRLNGSIACLRARDGAVRESLARFRRAGQLLREIAGQLSAGNRKTYLSTRHAQSLLRALSTG